MALSLKQQERERRAVADFDCPSILCNQPKGQVCYSPRRQQGNHYIPARPLVHPHKERIALVPDRTAGARSFEEMFRDHKGRG